MRKNSKKFLAFILAVVLFPETSHAYVDPGFLGALYQVVYMFIFGVLAVWVLKPFKIIGTFFKRIKARFKTGRSE